MTNFFAALGALLKHDLATSDTVRSQKILSVIDEIKKLADVAGAFIPIPQAAAAVAIVDEVDAVAHKLIPTLPTAPAVVTRPVVPAPVVTNPSQPAPVPIPTAAQVLAADLAKISQDLLKQ